MVKSCLFVSYSRENQPQKMVIPCIFKVGVVGETNPDVFTPKNVSIGPIHLNRTLVDWKIRKLRYLKDFTGRVGIDNINRFRDYLNLHETFIRKSYGLDLSLSCSELVELILSDSVFVMEALLKNWEYSVLKSQKGEQADFLKWPKLKFQLIRDMLLLENQIPLFVELELWKIYTEMYEMGGDFVDLFARLVEVNAGLIPKEACHLLDLMRKLEIGGWGENEITTAHVQLFSATELKSYGLKFKSIQRDSGIYRFSKRMFCSPCLYLPRIYIDGGWESRLSNMIAFEDLFMENDKHKIISQLIYLVRGLVQTLDDMKVMMVHKVIVLESPGIRSGYDKLLKVAKLLESPYARPKICEEIDKYV